MPPRPYDRRLRLAAAAEAKRRIVRAAVELHAERGPLGTSHARLARRAGVSIPTVYKHFPTANDLTPECTGCVLREAPVALDESLFDGLASAPERLRALASALFRLHEYLAPWARWMARDAGRLPALRTFVAGATAQRRALIGRALGRRPRSLLVFADLLLDWPAWRALTDEGLPTAGAAKAAADAVIALIQKP